MSMRYMKKYLLFAVLASLFMICEVGMDLSQPTLMAKIVNQGVLGESAGGSPSMEIIRNTGLLMLVIVFCGGMCGILSGVFTNLCAQKSGNDIRKDCFRRIMHFSFQQTDDFTPGSLITRITSDVTQVQNMISQLVRGVVRCLMFLAGGSIMLSTLDLHFMTVLVIAVPLILVEIAVILHKADPLFMLLQRRLDRMNNIVEENVAGARVVKAFAQEDHERERFSDANQKLVKTQMDVLVLMAWMSPLMNIVLNLSTVAVIKIGGLEAAAGALEAGSVIAAVTYLTQILNAMNMLAMLFQTFSRGKASERRLQEVLDTFPVINDGKASCEKKERGSVVFSHVSFHYPGFDEMILKDINLEIRPGEMLAITGETGSGKSTLINLIPRFYDVCEGSVMVDGVDVRDWKISDLRDAVSVVMQKSELFSTDIKDNIERGKRGAGDDEIREAAEAAQADSFIRSQKEGYDTPVTENGMSLSGGQKQRIAVARGILHGGEILILDDATSALDLITEAGLHKAVREKYRNMTRIVIAQRAATIMRADRIAVLDGGRIIACDTHENLLETCSLYREICRSQSLEAVE
ncbi:MAG: ABC transporter ATP-binding protein [Anaerovoracaceae bacterium]|jgi:ATP-binding cassette subfamily B multidrug efflux pump